MQRDDRGRMRKFSVGRMYAAGGKTGAGVRQSRRISSSLPAGRDTFKETKA
jgi:hypothetical protein